MINLQLIDPIIRGEVEWNLQMNVRYYNLTSFIHECAADWDAVGWRRQLTDGGGGGGLFGGWFLGKHRHDGVSGVNRDAIRARRCDLRRDLHTISPPTRLLYTHQRGRKMLTPPPPITRQSPQQTPSTAIRMLNFVCSIFPADIRANKSRRVAA